MSEAWQRYEQAREHELKVWPQFFDALLSGDKTFEVRKDDRGFHVGDVLWLREYRPEQKCYSGHCELNGCMGENMCPRKPAFYTGRELRLSVTYILAGRPWLADGYVVMGLAALDDAVRAIEGELLDALEQAWRAYVYGATGSFRQEHAAYLESVLRSRGRLEGE
jgi:hypothetical protein